MTGQVVQHRAPRSGEGRAEMEAKLHGEIENGRVQATALLERLATDHISDSLVKIGPGANGRGGRILLIDDPKTDRTDQVGFEFGGRVRTFHPNAAVQFGEKLGLPGSWLRDSINGKAWQRAMVADVMSTTLNHTEERDRILVRSVGDQVRGILSDKYRRLNSPVIADTAAKAFAKVGAVATNAIIEDLKWNLTALLPHIIPVTLPNHGEQFISAGVRIGNSDFGAGSLELRFLWKRLSCLNGATLESVMREIHLGAKLPDDLTFSEETYRLDTEMTASALGDLVTQLLTVDGIRTRLEPIQIAAAEVIEPTKAIEKLVRASRITKGEAETVTGLLVESDPSKVPEGPATRFKLAQAISWLSHGADGIDRKSELEALAGLLTNSAASLN